MKNFNQKIVVTGGSGLVGSHLIGELIRRGADNIVVPLRSLESLQKTYKTLSYLGYSDPAQIVKERCVVVVVQLNNPHEIGELMSGTECVFNCAANVSLKDEGDIIACNVELTTHIVDAAIEAKVKLLVHVSSIATLGSSSSTKTHIDEESMLSSVKRCSAYSVSKFYSENVVRYGVEFGLPTIIVNPSVIIGEGDWSGNSSASLIPLISSGAMFSTNGVTGYIDVRDVVRAMIELSITPRAIGEQFILSAENLSFMELMTKASKVANRRAPFIIAGKFIVALAYCASKIGALVSGKASRFSKSAARSALKKNLYDGSKVRRFIDFEYSPIDEAIRRSVDSYINKV